MGERILSVPSSTMLAEQELIKFNESMKIAHKEGKGFQLCRTTSVADLDPDPVVSGPFCSDLDVWERIRFRILTNDSVSTFLVCVKVINT
jgi:hypothetical protein